MFIVPVYMISFPYVYFALEEIENNYIYLFCVCKYGYSAEKVLLSAAKHWSSSLIVISVFLWAMKHGPNQQSYNKGYLSYT